MSLICDSCGVKIIDEQDGFLCDYPVGTIYKCKQNEAQTHSTLNISRVTCDAHLCSRCAIEIWPKAHLCPKHARNVQQKIINAMFFVPKEAREKVDK